MPTLFDPLKIGDLEVPNRILLAPLTRNRSTGPGRVPNAMMREYYTQRASAGLIISEATSVAPAGDGYPHTPGVWSDEQVEGWRNVVATAAKKGIPVPAFSTALAFYDQYRSAVLPANLLQAQRDYFGAHTYERVDKPRGEFFHTNWTGRGGTTSSSTYNV